jgi:hypothetical protein
MIEMKQNGRLVQLAGMKKLAVKMRKHDGIQPARTSDDIHKRAIGYKIGNCQPRKHERSSSATLQAKQAFLNQALSSAFSTGNFFWHFPIEIYCPLISLDLWDSSSASEISYRAI